MAGDRYLTKRGNVWWFQLSVPKAFRQSIGKTCIRVSLETGDRREAAKRARQHIDYWHAEFDRLKGIPPQRLAEIAAELSALGVNMPIGESQAVVAEIKATANRFRVVTADKVGRVILDRIYKYREIVPHEDVFPIINAPRYAVPLMEQMGATEDKAAVIEDIALELAGQKPKPRKAEGRTLDALLAAWERERKPAKRTLHEYRYTVRRFNEWFGQLQVKDVNRSHVSEFRGVLLDIPARVSNADTRLPIKELLEKFDGTDCQRSSPLAASRRLDALRTLFNLAIQSGWIESNPCTHVKIDDDGDTKRRAFTLDETRKALKALEGRDDSLAWVIRIGVYTGARLGEICQLRGVDVRHTDGIAYLSVNTEQGKTVKTPESVRDVPIHPDIRDEFLAFVASRGDGPLFADIQPHKNRTVAERVTKMFAEWMGEAGLAAEGLVFHSWRHGFKNRCRDAEVPEETHDALTGHAPRSTGRRYGNRPRLSVLAAAVDRLRFLP